MDKAELDESIDRYLAAIIRWLALTGINTMPFQEVAYLRQRAVLWPAVGSDTFGQPTVGAPVEIACRWLTNRREVLDRQGNTVSIDGTVIVAVDVPIGSHLWLGTLAQWYGTGSAGQGDQELCEAKTFDSTPDIKNRATFRQVGIVRLHNRGSN